MVEESHKNVILSGVQRSREDLIHIVMSTEFECTQREHLKSDVFNRRIFYVYLYIYLLNLFFINKNYML